MICCDFESEYLLGLKSDGTAIAIGENEFGQCNVENWKNIASVVASTEYSIGIGEDGDISYSGEIGDLKEIDNWSNIKDIATVVATGSNEYGQCNVGQLKEIVAIYAKGATITTCLDKKGLVHFVGKDELKGLSWNKKIKLF